MTVTVDMLCIGYGPGPLAAAVLAARAGMSVVYIEALPEELPNVGSAVQTSWPGVLSDRWESGALGPELRTYINELTDGMGAPLADQPPLELPFTDTEPSTPAERRPDGSIPRFDGSQLRTWARNCLHSSSGVVSTRVTLPGATKVRSATGEVLEVSVVSAMPGNGLGEVGLHGWLLDTAREVGVQVHNSSDVRQLLFEGGQPAGAVVETATGNGVVWTRHGVVLGIGSRGSYKTDLPLHGLLPTGSRLCLCSRPASRFARLELVRENKLPAAALLTPQAALHSSSKHTDFAVQRRERVDAVGVRRERHRGWHVNRRSAHW